MKLPPLSVSSACQGGGSEREHVRGLTAGAGAQGLCYSFPVTCAGGKWSIVQGLPIDPASRAKMDATAKELEEERVLALQCLGESS